MNNKYKYSYESTPDYCYPNTDILINKENIKDGILLDQFEREIVSLNQLYLESTPVKGNFDLIHLKDIHKFLFHEIYYWAGDLRTVAIAKTDMFCLPQYIESYAEDIFTKLEYENYYLKYNTETKVKKLVELFSDINAMHPFREGNGRTQREFIECLAKVIGIDLDLSQISQDDMIIASHEANNGNTSKMHRCFVENYKDLSIDEQLDAIHMIISNQKVIDELEHILQPNQKLIIQ